MAIDNRQSPVEIRRTSLDELRTRLAERPGSLYAVLDACDEPRVPAKALELGEERVVCLYRGSAMRDYWAIAPYLAQVDEPLLDWIVESLWDDPWGIFAIAPTDLETLRKHFRRFLKVHNPEGKELLFRFYDPRILPVFLPTCLPWEAERFYGPIDGFVVNGEPDGLSVFRRADRPSPKAGGPTGDDSGQPAAAPVGRRGSLWRIRPQQKQAFSEYLIGCFVDRMIRRLQDDFSVELAGNGLDDKDLEPLVRRAIARSKQYGIVNEGDVERYILCTAVMGPQFDVDRTIPWAGEILRKEHLDGKLKMDQIVDHLTSDADEVD